MDAIVITSTVVNVVISLSKTICMVLSVASTLHYTIILIQYHPLLNMLTSHSWPRLVFERMPN